MSYDYLLKTIILGDSGVGKTCLAESMVLQQHRPEYVPTIGVDFRTYTALVDKNKNVKLHIWDTAGNESFRKIIVNYCRGVSCVAIVFDVTNRESFGNVETWLSYFQASNECTSHTHPIFIVANKVDQSHKRVVTKEEGKRLATANKLYYMETSAVAALNTTELRNSMVTEVFSKIISCDTTCKGYNIMHDYNQYAKGRKDVYIRMPYTTAKSRLLNYPRCCNIL
jgi:small GTP-binding protein